jgi:hypothetical protein
MDTTIIFTLVLSALFLGSILWLVIYSRRQQGAAVRARRAETPAGKDVSGRPASGGKKTG